MTGYRLTPTAEGDLREILQYVAEHDGLDRALRVHELLEHSFKLLASAPRSGRVRKELTGTSLRWWTVSGFVVVYEAEHSAIKILRVLHGMRDLDALM